MDCNSEEIRSQGPEPCEAIPEKHASPYADSPYVTYYEQTGKEPPKVAPKRPKKKAVKERRSGRIRWVAVFLVLVLVLGSCTATALIQNSLWQEKYDLLTASTNNRINALQKQLEGMGTSSGVTESVREPGEGLTPAQIYQQNVNAVVSIRTQNSSGTGFVISADGYVVSNYHVVEGATSLQVITVDETAYNAVLVGYDKTNDVSLMKIEAENLPFVTIGSSDELQVGDRVVAIGNALGELTATLTVGYVSGKDRIVNTDGTAINMLQTDASINSGNSGGPLFNIYGEVVGITTAKYTGESNSGATIEGIGFAIPINDVFGMLEDIRDYGYVTGAYLGVSVRDVDPTVTQAYGIPSGAYVVEVVEGVSADRAGILPKDVIINLGGYDVTSVNVLTRVLRKFEPGETTTVTVFRSGAEVHLEITFDEKPQPEETLPQETVPKDTVPKETWPGMTPQDPSQDELPWWYDFFSPFFWGN